MNRAGAVRDSLQRLLAQLEAVPTAQYEVVVVDGSAGDATRRNVEALCVANQAPWCYERQEPRGFDRAFDAAVAAAHGEFCWLLPDDDELFPGAVEAVMTFLRRHDPDCLVVNGELRHFDLKRVLIPRILSLSEDRYFGCDDHATWVETLAENQHLGYVGAFVLRRTEWLSRERQRYYDTDFMPVGVVLQRPFPRGTGIIAEPQMALRSGTSFWLPRGYHIWTFSWPEVVWASPVLDEKTKREIAPRDLWRDPGRTGIMRAKGMLSWRDYRQRLRFLPLGWKLRLWVFVLCTLPVYWADRLMVVLIKTKWRHGGYGLDELALMRECRRAQREGRA
jgi:glycosyltransferase involved in cell wall biosynthesis